MVERLLLKSYGYKPGSPWGTDPLYIRQGGRNHWCLTDHLGTPQQIVAENGAVVWQTQYKVFGKAEVDAGSSITNNLRFPGQYYDAETGLHYNWNRCYDPEAGRYTQTDPIGFEGGDVNLYGYVLQNNIRFFDSDGLYVMLCSRELGGINSPATSPDNIFRHDYLNVSGTILGFRQEGSFTFSSGTVDRGRFIEYVDDKRCHTMICDDPEFDKYVLIFANYITNYSIAASSSKLLHYIGIRNCQTWAATVIQYAKQNYLEAESCPKCFR